MSEHDPLLALGGLIDEPVAPRPAFAEALRAQLIAELGTDGQPKEKERPAMHLTAVSVTARRFDSRPRTRRQRLMMLCQIAAVAAIAIGLVAALSSDRRDHTDSPTPASNSIPAMMPSGPATPEATPEQGDGILPDGMLWEKPLAAGLYGRSSMVVVDNVIVRAITTSIFSGLEGIDASTGEQLWKREYGWSGQITSGDGLVYVSGSTGQGISAIDPTTGETRWNSVSMVGNSSFPVFADGVVYTWSTANIVFAVDGETGASLWQANMTTDSASSGVVIWSELGLHTPAVGASVVVVASAGGRLYAFDRARGERLWTYDPPSGASAIRYASSDETLFLVVSYASEDRLVPLRIQGIDLATGSVIWQTAGFGNITQTPVITTNPRIGDTTVSLIAQEVQSADQAGTPFAIPASNTSIVFTLDVKTGTIIKQSHGTNYTAIASTDDGTGLLVWPLNSRSTNEPIDLGQPIDGVPVKAGETIFVTLQDGTLVAIDRTKVAAG